MSLSRTVLFVDENYERANDLLGLASSGDLAWEFTTTSNVEQAQQLLTEEEYCLVAVSRTVDGVDGTDLLRFAREYNPLAARFLVLDSNFVSASMHSGSLAHQVLAAHLEPPAILDALNRAISLRDMLANVGLRCAAGNLDRLPSAPRIYLAIREAAADPDVSIGEIAAIIEQDVALTANILRIVNSSVFGLAQETRSIQHAAAHLGLDMVRSVCLSTEVTTKFEAGLPPGFSFDEQQDHVNRMSKLLSKLIDDKLLAERAILASFLHDVGTLVQVTQLPDHFRRVHSMDGHVRMTLSELERRVLGVTHAELGAYLLGLWGLPFEVVEAVAYHHEPSRGGARELGVLGWIHIADSLLEELDGAPLGGKPSHLDPNFLRSIDVTPDQVNHWRQIAADCFEGDAPLPHVHAA